MLVFISKISSPTLLTLPPELREVIFAFALASPKPTVTFTLDPYQRDAYREATQPPLTQVSRQIRREALPLFYETIPFVLHTEGTKAADAERWLHYAKPHLPKLSKLEFWVRYVAPTNDRGVASGALGVSMFHEPRTGRWVVRDEWRWVTANRKASDAERDGELLLKSLNEVIAGRGRSEMVAEEYVAILTELKGMYLQSKLGHLI